MSAGSTDKATAEQAWRAFKRRHAGTATVDLILPDLAGIARGKRLSAAAFEGAIAAGIDAALIKTERYGV